MKERDKERERIVELIDETWKDRKQTTDKIMFMMDFKEELKKRIEGENKSKKGFGRPYGY